MRECTSCKLVLPLSDYYIGTCCRKCVSKHKRDYYKEHEQEIKDKNKAYKLANPKKVRKHRHAYYLKHKGAIRERCYPNQDKTSV